MSRYTVELRYLEKEQWTDAFMFGNYPIFNEAYRETLNQKIRDHYAFEEIGFETPARFCHRMRTKMQEIMPYYNKLYQSELAEIDPFLTKRYSHTSNDIMNAVGSKTSDTTRELKDVMKDIIESLTKREGQNTDTTTTNIDQTNTMESAKQTHNTGFSNDKTESENIDNVLEDNNQNTGSNSSETSHVDNAIMDGIDSTGQQTTTFNDVKNVSVKTGSTSHDENVVHDRVTKTVASDTPEGLVSLNDIENSMYASNATISHEKDTPNGKNTDTYNNVTDTNTKSGSEVVNTSSNSSETKFEDSNADKKNSEEGFTSSINMKNSTSKNNSTETKTDEEIGTDVENTTNKAISDDKSVTVHDIDERTGFHSEENKTDVVTELINTVIKDINDETKNGSLEVVGFDGITMSEMLMKWRDTFLNIDMMIIGELETLFMGILEV